MMQYLDANVFIFASVYSEDDVRVKNAQEILTRVVHGHEQCITSVLTVDEVVWAWMKQKKDREQAILQGLRLHALPNIKLVEITSMVSLKSLELMQRFHRLKPRDALHTATALLHGATTIVSDDPDFDDVPELKRIPLA